MQSLFRNFVPGILKHIKDDITTPHGSNRYLVNFCDTEGNWITGRDELGRKSNMLDDLHRKISKRWPQPEQHYRMWYRTQDQGNPKFRPGEIQLVQVQTDLVIVNALCAVWNDNSGHSTAYLLDIDEEDLIECLKKLSKEVFNEKGSVHILKFESNDDLWKDHEKTLNDMFIKQGTNVVVYEDS